MYGVYTCVCVSCMYGVHTSVCVICIYGVVCINCMYGRVCLCVWQSERKKRERKRKRDLDRVDGASTANPFLFVFQLLSLAPSLDDPPLTWQWHSFACSAGGRCGDRVVALLLLPRPTAVRRVAAILSRRAHQAWRDFHNRTGIAR